MPIDIVFVSNTWEGTLNTVNHASLGIGAIFKSHAIVFWASFLSGKFLILFSICLISKLGTISVKVVLRKLVIKKCPP